MTPRHPPAPPEVRTSAMLDPARLATLLARQRHLLVSVPASDGVELHYWQSAFKQPVTLDARGDEDRVLFTYQLRGCAHCWLDRGPASRGEYMRENAGSVHFAPGRHSRFHQQGACESVSVAVRPDVLRGWIDDLDPPLRRSLDSGACFVAGYRGARLHEAAYALGHALKHASTATPTTAGARLVHEGHALLLLGQFLEAGRAGGGRHSRVVTHRQQLLAARDHLLADLAHPPTLAQMALEAGISAIRIKRGFRELFGHSVYGLFQQERMREARRRLQAGGVTVMEVAFGLGYSNPSHFAAAFRKQFGIAPGEYKRSQPLTPAGSTPWQSDAAPPSSSAP
ncbi:MAG: helix-turn-helix transcriptional regulator [Achromobacter sp.]|uniref:helix-turn-helix transcriptional regulator n=1 Tax=Achromobacter sp. TaxID=134375 RepID=UPI003D06E463